MTLPNATRQGSVLIAEDDRVMSDLIRFNLERIGYDVTVAPSGTEAWTHLQTHSFDILVTDYQMPGMSGEEVCRLLRKTFPDLQMPIIFLSARGHELNVDRMKAELGIEMLLFKPFSPRLLSEAVAACLARVAVPV